MSEVREAVTDDLPWLVGMGLRFIRDSDYRHHVAENPGALARLMGRLMESGESVILVVGDRPHGMIGMLLYDHPMSGEKFASELFWWIDPEQRGSGLRLLNSAERWAKEAGARRIQMIAPNDRTARAYEGLGYGKLETHYQKEIT